MRPLDPQYHYSNFLHPRYWATWLLIFVMYLVCFLSYERKLRLGEWLGRKLHKYSNSRRRIAEGNIRACFPELSPKEQAKMVLDTFISNATGYVECIIAWWCPYESFLENSEVYGMEHLKEAQRRGKGIFLIGGHFSIMDFGAPLVHHYIDFNYMYRPQKNKLFNALIERSRRHYSLKGFDKHQLPEMIEFIKQGNLVWYGPDQDFGIKKGKSVFAPFFNLPAASLTTPAWIARETGATVLQISQFREKNGVYSVYFSPILENFPGDDEVENATRINAGLEQGIRHHPDQYLWLHRRFKTRPEGEASIY